MYLIYNLGINHYWVDEHEKKNRRETSVPLLSPVEILPANTHLSTSVNLSSQKKYQHQLRFSLFYNLIIVCAVLGTYEALFQIVVTVLYFLMAFPICPG